MMLPYHFITGGNAVFTVSNPAGERYTFRIRKPAKNKPYFTQLLTGPSNMSDYTYMGVFLPANDDQEPYMLPRVRLTAKSRYKGDSKPVRVFNWAVKALWYRVELPEGYAIQHAGKCCRCGRRLTVPESIENGIGPECGKYLTDGKNWNNI